MGILSNAARKAAGQLAFPPEIVGGGELEPGATLADRFEAFADANPAVEESIVAVARELRDEHGIQRAGIALIFERLRWLYAIRTQGDAYRLNNSFRAFYARRIMERHEDLAGFFEVRRQSFG